MSDKKFTPQEAAVLVLKKAEELYKSSSLAKGDWAKIHSKLKREGYSEESADKIDGAIKAKMNKSDEQGQNPDAKADADLGEKVEQDVQEHEEKNSDPAHAEPQMRGHIKLAKFMGRMEHKKGQKSKEMDKSEEARKGVLSEDASKMSGKTGNVRATTESNQNQTGINQTGNNGRSGGMSEAGNMVRNAQFSTPKGAAEAKQGAKSIHEATLNQIHQMSKPKLPG
jgi:hypothetical protein